MPAPHATLSPFVTPENTSGYSARLQLSGLHCANCVAAVERGLQSFSNIEKARVNFSTHILDLRWQGTDTDIDMFAEKIRALGYGLSPLEATPYTAEDETVKPILRALVWAGFGAGNMMLFAAPVWFSDSQAMDPATRQLMHWFMALIALVVVPIAGQPFFKSAWAALKARRTNMDVPISVGVILSTLVSLYGLAAGAAHVYFDAGVMLLFFLLIGRYLDAKMRARARGAAASVLSLLSATATIVEPDGTYKRVPLNKLDAGMVLAVAAGERIMADGVVLAGEALLDTSLLTGETEPQRVQAGANVTSGSIPLDAPLRITVSVPHENTLLAQIVKTMTAASQEKSHYVRLADKIARAYTPVVHVLAAVTLAGWLYQGEAVPEAVMHAVSVLIITCPCALGLAVPVVQILAASRLMKKQVVLKTADALERLSQIDTVALDKTGTITLGKPTLVAGSAPKPQDLGRVLALAQASSHPLSRALVAAYAHQTPDILSELREVHGQGMEGVDTAGTIVRLGRRSFVGAPETQSADTFLELWVRVGSETPYRLAFADKVREDAANTISTLKGMGLKVLMLSGDRVAVAQHIAAEIGIEQFQGGLSPLEKAEALKHATANGHKVLMVGDGLNDAPGLAGAHAALSPATGMDITQNAADAIFMGEKLMPVAETIDVARKAQKLVISNFKIAILYNVVAVPLAMLGYCTPVVAAVSMSLSSVFVVANALRLVREKPLS